MPQRCLRAIEIARSQAAAKVSRTSSAGASLFHIELDQRVFQQLRGFQGVPVFGVCRRGDADTFRVDVDAEATTPDRHHRTSPVLRSLRSKVTLTSVSLIA
ncbi:hypothetical protein D9M69_03960 [compost metagenome]